MKYNVVTFGCRVNQADSLEIEAMLRARGGVAAPSETADLVVVNSCSVTASADQGTRQVVRRIARMNPAAKIVVTGCYASRRPDEVALLPNVTGIVRNDHKETIGAVVDGILPESSRAVDGDGPCGTALGPGVAGRTALTLRVQTGCDEPCSYCIIPSTRGHGRSRPMAVISTQIDRAIEAGYKEIVITGVHLGSYGRDLGTGVSLNRLVDCLAARSEDVLFRISSLEPMDCTPNVVGAIAGSPRLAPHLHLPLQSGSDQILRAMRRPYTSGQFAELVLRISDAMPWASIGTDLIVGFPGEDEDNAAATAELVARLPLSHLHVFPYSDRPGTEASRLPGKVDGMAIRERSRHLRAIGERHAQRFRASQAGSRRRALTVDDGRSAVTDNYLKVSLEETRPRNTWVEVAL